MKTIWLVFNAVMVIFFGFLHQGGVTPSLLHFQQLPNLGNTTHIVYYHTYMPPRSLLLSSPQKQFTSNNYEVHDLGGVMDEELMEYVNKLQPQAFFIVAPGSVHLPTMAVCDNTNQNTTPPKICKQIWPHLSTEQWPHSLYEMTLNIYSCAC